MIRTLVYKINEWLKLTAIKLTLEILTRNFVNFPFSDEINTILRKKMQKLREINAKEEDCSKYECRVMIWYTFGFIQ